MDKQKALELWDVAFNGKDYSYDFANRKIKKTEYLEKNSVGWIIGYLYPLELGGKDYDGNWVIMHHETAEEKGLNYPKFTVLHREYTVLYDKKDDNYYIDKVSSGDIDEGGLV